MHNFRKEILKYYFIWLEIDGKLIRNYQLLQVLYRYDIEVTAPNKTSCVDTKQLWWNTAAKFCEKDFQFMYGTPLTAPRKIQFVKACDRNCHFCRNSKQRTFSERSLTDMSRTSKNQHRWSIEECTRKCVGHTIQKTNRGDMVPISSAPDVNSKGYDLLKMALSEYEVNAVHTDMESVTNTAVEKVIESISSAKII